MCELLAISAKRRLRANEILREFYSHSPEHPHGWGLTRLSDGGAPSVDREPVEAIRSDALKRILESPVEETTLIAHIRRATVGDLDLNNCHPFVCHDNANRPWTFAHNGTIFDGASLNSYMGLQFGTTDSERAFLNLMDRVNERQIKLGRPLDEDERFDVVAGFAEEFSKGNKFNFLLHDGKTLYAHVNSRSGLHLQQIDGGIVFSTKPLSVGSWDEVPFTRLVAVRGGEIVREGSPHGYEYIHNPEDYRFLYMDFSMM